MARGCGAVRRAAAGAADGSGGRDGVVVELEDGWKSSRRGAPCRCGCGPVGDEPAVGGFGLFGELALAFAVGALAVGVLGRQGAASGVPFGAGAQFEGAELLAGQRRSLVGVVLF